MSWEHVCVFGDSVLAAGELEVPYASWSLMSWGPVAELKYVSEIWPQAKEHTQSGLI